MHFTEEFWKIIWISWWLSKYFQSLLRQVMSTLQGIFPENFWK